MTRARVEIINEEINISNFEDLDPGTIFEYEGKLYLKVDNGCEAVALANNEYLGCLMQFYEDDSVVVCDKAVITIKTRAE